LGRGPPWAALFVFGVLRVTADERGDYRVALTPGTYILDVQDRAAKRIYANPQPFTVVSSQTVRVDLSIFIGFAKGKASAYSVRLI
jgi:hypothetical protein